MTSVSGEGAESEEVDFGYWEKAELPAHEPSARPEKSNGYIPTVSGNDSSLLTTANTGHGDTEVSLLL